MGRGRIGRIGAALVALTLFTAACGDDDDATPTESGDEVSALAVSAVDFGFEGLPDEVAGGAVEIEFTNEGEAQHEIAFAEIGDTGLDQFLEDFAPVFEGGPIPDYVTNIVGANEADPGETEAFTYTLSEGTYAVFCALTALAGDPEGEGEIHYELGMKDTIDVTEGDDPELPEADGTITALDYSFEVDLEGGDTTINFENTGPDQLHFAGFDVFPEGTTPEEAEEAFNTFLGLEEGQEPPEGLPEPEEVGFSGVATPGNQVQFEVPGGFQSGRTYLFYCFIQDRSGGPPHALPEEAGGHGMVKAFTIE